jgi:hypothetical protein
VVVLPCLMRREHLFFTEHIRMSCFTSLNIAKRILSNQHKYWYHDIVPESTSCCFLVPI